MMEIRGLLLLRLNGTHTTWFPGRSIQLQILNAFNSSFFITPIIVSQDDLQYWTNSDPIGTRTSSMRIGWHDDSFAEDFFLDILYISALIQSLGFQTAYERVVFGGEVLPGYQSEIFEPGNTATQNFTQCVMHTTWLIDTFAFEDDTDTQRVENTKAGALLLGYQFYVDSIQIINPESCSSLTGSYCVTVQVSIRNTGVAPLLLPIILNGSLQIPGTVTC